MWSYNELKQSRYRDQRVASIVHNFQDLGFKDSIVDKTVHKDGTIDRTRVLENMAVAT